VADRAWRVILPGEDESKFQTFSLTVYGDPAVRRESLTAKGESVVASAIGEEAIVADAMEAVRQSMQEEAPHELIGIKRHHLALRFCR
jgi:hypothetical protein